MVAVGLRAPGAGWSAACDVALTRTLHLRRVARPGAPHPPWGVWGTKAGVLPLNFPQPLSFIVFINSNFSPTLELSNVACPGLQCCDLSANWSLVAGTSPRSPAGAPRIPSTGGRLGSCSRRNSRPRTLTGAGAAAAEIWFEFSEANYAKYTNPEPFKIPPGLEDTEDSAWEICLLCCLPLWSYKVAAHAEPARGPGDGHQALQGTRGLQWDDSLLPPHAVPSPSPRGLRGSLVLNVNSRLGPSIARLQPRRKAPHFSHKTCPR